MEEGSFSKQRVREFMKELRRIRISESGNLYWHYLIGHFQLELAKTTKVLLVRQ